MSGTLATALDRALAWLAPGWARDRLVARLQFRALAGVHQATRPGRNRKIAREMGSGNRIVSQDAAQLRAYARALERDDDISANALNVLEQNIVGSGIGVEPSPRLPGQPVDRELAAQLADLWGDFWTRPEVSWLMDLGKAQRLLCRTWMRDGEAFFQRLKGPVDFLDHGTDIPYSVELFEPDMVPLDYDDPARSISQGIQVNGWGRPTGYWLYKRHPGDSMALREEMKFVPAERIGHIALTTRVGQRRGLSVFASVIARLADLKDFEDAERIAAKIAASLTAYIKKGDPALYGQGATATTLDAGPQYRDMQMRPGLIVDDLLPGEDVGMIKSDRPNPNAVTWREGQLRAVSGGVRVSFSSLAKNYNGTYSAQRQELVEGWAHYGTLSGTFIHQFCEPIWWAFVDAAIAARLVVLPASVDPETIWDATHAPPPMPWIDPLKEISANELAEKRLYKSRSRIIRERGENPAQVLQEIKRDQDEAAALGLQREDAPAPPAAPEPPDTGE